ncbi:putative 2OG-Fe(II) oxygenase, partial [Alphaproteobacteria bacterium]|nr:putative 2OG-Fe(II) oxygenase [Alphaproteobacteria bacterium]
MSQLENTPGKPEFKQLWPTQFMSLSLPGHDTANPVLADHLLEQNIARDDMTVDYTSDNLFMTDHPAVIWLRQCCDRAVLDYSRHAGIDYDLEWILQGWANVNMRGDYHNLHNHPHSWLSGTYYVSVPDQTDADTFRSDLNPSAISFFDPRPQANMNSIR